MASFHDLAATSLCFFLLFIFLLSGGLTTLQIQVHAQQPYGKEIADCPNKHNSSGLLGYHCGVPGGAPSCPTFLTFNALPPYSTLASIASLLGADASSLAAANGVGAAAPLAAGTRVLVPATCSCTSTPDGRFYQRNATSYVAQPGDTLLIIANATFQGLTSCQALQSQALDGAPPESLDAGQRLPAVPLRCACPSAAQAAKGDRFLVTYLVGWFDDVSAVAARFGVDAGDVIAANELQPPSYTIYPFTTLLVPVKAQPNVSQIQTLPSPPPPPPVAPVAPPAPGKKGGNRVGVYIGVAVAVAVAAIASAGAVLALRRRRAAGAVVAAGEVVPKKGGKGNGTGDDTNTGTAFTSTLSTSEAFSSSISISLTDIKSSLKVYTYGELTAATDNFSADRRIGRGSVYRAEFDGDAAAVEVVDGRDVSAEVELMRRAHHANLLRLAGLCRHAGRWYLVTEFADHGSLRHRLLISSGEPPLTWAQRVRVALDVAEGLRYLHEHARPACVHMGVSSGAVLLAGDGPRAKLRGFAAARQITGATTGEDESTAMFTMTSTIAGTRGYMAPEYLEHGVVSPKADVYSLGVVMLELVTGKGAEELVGDGVGDPFAALRELVEELDGGGEEGVVLRLEELVDPAMAAGSVPRDGVVVMVRLIERCVRRDAASRPSAGEVARRLLKLSGVAAVGWAPNSPEEESPRSSGSDKGLMY
ncbi:unnamed protein product [Urochloa decumbens]|uniref:Protein kinase domain-containing protein n=1 Tax=Urochloa decumbens TaxID=240449 RepID=A0ABC9B5W4_9POAL